MEIKNNRGIWFFGLSGSGKTYLSKCASVVMLVADQY